MTGNPAIDAAIAQLIAAFAVGLLLVLTAIAKRIDRSSNDDHPKGKHQKPNPDDGEDDD